jgi:hypothetical protein
MDQIPPKGLLKYFLQLEQMAQLRSARVTNAATFERFARLE